MALTFGTNVFKPSEIKSKVLNPGYGKSYECKLYGTAVAGTFVKIKDVAGSKLRVVEACTADTDQVFGIIPYNAVKNSYASGDKVNVVRDFTTIVCEASEAISAGATVMPVISGLKVATQTTGKAIIGEAVTPAAQAGDLIEVMIKIPVKAST